MKYDSYDGSDAAFERLVAGVATAEEIDYDGTDESFEELLGAYQADELARNTCPAPREHNLHTDGRWMFEACPRCGANEPLSNLDLLARADAERDFAAVAAREVPEGTCHGCGTQSAELVPWSGQRLCWGCTDTQLDIMAAALLADAPVLVRAR